MKKKLLAGILAFTLCSANMPFQTIFAQEFTSGNPEEVSVEENTQVFTDERPNAEEQTSEELEVFSSEHVPEFYDNPDEGMVAAEDAQSEEIDLTNPATVSNEIYTINSAGTYKFTCNNGNQTANRIVIDGANIPSESTIKIYLNNVNILTYSGPALQIKSNVSAQVCIYLENENNLITKEVDSAGLQKDNTANLTIDNVPNTTGTLTADSYISGAGIGGGYMASCSNITINGGSINASSLRGAGIGSGYGGHSENGSSCSNITINGGSINASSTYGAGIGSGSGGESSNGPCSNITISNGSVNASSTYGAGIGSGSGGITSSGFCSNITISNGSVNASSLYGAGIGSGIGEMSSGSCSNITISGGSVNANSNCVAGIGSGLCDMSSGSCSNITISGGSVNAKIGCIPHQNLDSSGNYDPDSPNVYLCTIPNEGNASIIIDDTPWNIRNHAAVDPNDKNLYAWLTGEDHIVTVGTDRRSYIFDSNSGKFNNTKRTVTSNIFEFNDPHEFTYDGTPHTPSLTKKNTIKGIGNFTVKYFKENDSANQINAPKDVGTYIIKIDVEKGDFYNESFDLTDASWKFVINPDTLTPAITKYAGEYDGNSHPVINIDRKTIPPNSTIKYSINNGQTWETLNSDDDIPAVSTVKEAKNTKICIQISNSNYETWTGEYNAEIRPAANTPDFPSTTQISVPWSCKKVEDVKGFFKDDWKWSDSDICELLGN